MGLGAADEDDGAETALEVEKIALKLEETFFWVEELFLNTEESSVEIGETPPGTEDDCEGDGGRRLWRFRSGSPVTEPDLLVIFATVEKML